ncbi:MAG: PrsW family glutamic-type intramembrane protease [Balneolaceae bacterium]|nr:PrsW family glutamic-type intramembrane protease [Balneolaceae bacterium]
MFLIFMRVIDSFKLVSFRQTVVAIVVGAFSALITIFANYNLIVWLGMESSIYSRFVAPISEEFFKILFVVYLIQSKKVGFAVDATIFGFAVGTGFAIIENIYYLNALSNAGLLTWFVRGFGTAVMHGGTTAIAAILIKDISDRKEWPDLFTYLPGFLAAVFIHGLFNQFLLPPVTVTLLILIILPPLLYFIFKKSEKNTRVWLGTGLDSDMEMLRLLMAGNISESRIGTYLKSIENKFSAEIVGDIICYLRVYLELSVKAKGILIMKENDFDLPPDPEIKAQFEELKYLEENIGKTGKLAIQPLLKLNNADLWQLYMLQQDQKKPVN